MLETGSWCFQILRIHFPGGTEGYFYRPHFSHGTWVKFILEDYKAKQDRRRANQEARGEVAPGERTSYRNKW